MLKNLRIIALLMLCTSLGSPQPTYALATPYKALTSIKSGIKNHWGKLLAFSIWAFCAYKTKAWKIFTEGTREIDSEGRLTWLGREPYETQLGITLRTQLSYPMYPVTDPRLTAFLREDVRPFEKASGESSLVGALFWVPHWYSPSRRLSIQQENHRKRPLDVAQKLIAQGADLQAEFVPENGLFMVRGGGFISSPDVTQKITVADFLLQTRLRGGLPLSSVLLEGLKGKKEKIKKENAKEQQEITQALVNTGLPLPEQNSTQILSLISGYAVNHSLTPYEDGLLAKLERSSPH